jgi:pyroglutamyl-peptidase
MSASLPPTLLLTGFEPFGGERLNPTALVAEALHGQFLAGAQVQAAVLPCAFGSALDALDAALAATRPALVLALGQAAGRAAFTPERVAINVDDARIADNAGARPVDRPVVPGAPAAYFSTLPIKAMVAALRAEGWPAEVSQTAGTFVCNHVFFALMHQLHTRPALGGVRGGFMHVPLLPEQAAAGPLAGEPAIELADQVEAVKLALQAAWVNKRDLALAGGAES